MRTVRKAFLLLLCAALLLACGCKKQEEEITENEPGSEAVVIDDNSVVLTVGDVPVYATTYRYQVQARYNTIQKNNLYDRDTYLSYVVNPSVYYPYPYYDTRTEEGIAALEEGVLNELALEAASIYAAAQKGYTRTITDNSYVEQAVSTAADALAESSEDYGSEEAFLAEAGLTEESFVRMYTRSREASIDFSKILENYRAENPIDDETLAAGYARIVKETFEDRYADGMYSQYLYYYIAGARSYPSLYIPDDAIFVRLFVHTNPTETQIAAYTKLAEEDFNGLYLGEDNEFTSQGSVGDLAVAPKDELVEGLYAAAKDTAIGSVGAMSRESDGKTLYYLFLRVEGETGAVSIDRYPGVREKILNQLYGTFCMDTLRELVNDPSVTTRNETVLQAIRPAA